MFTAASGAATIAGFYIMIQSITALRLEMTGLQLEIMDLDFKIATVNASLKESQKDIRDMLIKVKYLNGSDFQADLNINGNLSCGTGRFLSAIQCDGSLTVMQSIYNNV